MFQKLHGQGMSKMYSTFILAALKAEKFQKPKCGSFLETPCSKKIIVSNTKLKHT